MESRSELVGLLSTIVWKRYKRGMTLLMHMTKQRLRLRYLVPLLVCCT